MPPAHPPRREPRPRRLPGAGLFLVLLLAGFLVSGAAAQTVPADTARDPAAIVTLTLGDAVRLALTRSLDLQRAGYQVDLSELDRQGAAAAGQPELSLSVGPTLTYARGYVLGADSTGPALGTDGDASAGLSASASLSLPLFDGGARRASRQAAEQALEASRRSRDRTAEDVASLAASQYVQVLQFAALVEVEETNLGADRALLERVQAEYDVGNRSLGDVLQQQASIAQGEQRLATARRNEAVARLSLRQTLRLPPGTPLALAPVADTLLAAPLAGTDTQTLVARALAERADLDAQAALIEAARFDVAGARTGRSPSLSLGSTAGTSASTLDDERGIARQLADVNPRASVGVTLSVPILDQGRTRRAVERAGVLLSDAEAVLELRRLQVAADVETAVLDVEAATARLAAAAEGVAAAREALAATEARYSVGAGIFLDVLDARRTLVQAETDVTTARFDLLLGRIAVAYQTGLLGDLLVALD